MGQRGMIACGLDTPAIDVLCIQLASPFSHSAQFQLHLPGDHEIGASGVVDVDVAISERADVALLDLIPVNSWLYAVRQRFVQSRQSLFL